MLFLCLIAGTYSKEFVVDHEKISAVKSGTLIEAKASWWGFEPGDATECLQKAIDSGVKKLIVDNTGAEWLIRPISLRSGLEIVFADGVIVRAKPGEFKSKNACLFSVIDQTGLIIRGEGKAILTMNKEDYKDTSNYEWSEWRHLLSLRGAVDVKIQNLTLKSSGGDGIYVSISKKLNGCRNVEIDEVVCDDHLRQGISVISAENLLVKNSKFINTSGAAPQCGIDFEPNSASEWLVNNIFENCEFHGNAASGIKFHLSPLTVDSRPISVIMKKCRSYDNSNNGINIMVSRTTQVGGTIIFEDCNIGDNQGGAVVLSNKQSNDLKVILRNTVLDNRKSQQPAILFSNAGTNADLEGVSFEKVRMFAGTAAPVAFHGMTGGGVGEIGGSLIIEKNNGQKTAYDLAKFIAANQPQPELRNFPVKTPDLKKLYPLYSDTMLENQPNPIRFRGRLKFIQYVDRAGEFPVHFRSQAVTRFPLQVEVLVKDGSGTDIDRFTITETEKIYHLKSTGPNIFVFEINTRTHTVTVDSAHPGNAFQVDTRTGMFKAKNQKLYFAVPPGIKEIKVEVTPDLNEPVSAGLLDPQGKIVDSFEKLQGSRQLRHERAEADKLEIWAINFTYAKEDFKIRLGAPLLPLVSSNPAALLGEK